MKTFNTKSILLMTVVLAAALAQAHVEPGSFLNKPARTVNQLVAQTERDPQVLDRYERHFQMSKGDLISYFEHLHVSKLQSTGSYVVYNVHDDEVIRARVFRLKAGMPIFADDSGKAILKISCGNPMVAPTPPVVIEVKPHHTPEHHYEAPPTPTPPAPQVIIVPPTPAAPVPAPVAPVVNNYAGGTVTNNNSSSKAYSSFFLLPIVLIFDTHHSHTTVVKQKQCVPEPASLLIMGFGAASMMIRKRKASKASV
jgi:PEP-CTERM motif